MTISNGTNGAHNGTSNSTNGGHNGVSNGTKNGASNGRHEHTAPPDQGLENTTPIEDNDISSAIAVIGVSGRFPGDGTTPRHLWDLLKEGKSALGEVPKSRFNVNGFYHPDGSKAGTFNTNKGYFLKQEVDRFDAGFFSITPEEARGMDPVQRILLELAYESLENGMHITTIILTNVQLTPTSWIENRSSRRSAYVMLRGSMPA